MDDRKNPLTLWVLRHAKAAAHGIDGDASRHLTGAGRRQAEEVGAHMASLRAAGQVPVPALVVCSTAVRARETGERVVASLTEGRIQFERELYSSDSEGVIELLTVLDPVERSIMVVGHNPTLHELCVVLTSGAESESLDVDGMPTAALVGLGIDGTVDAWNGLRARSARVVHRFVPGR